MMALVDAWKRVHAWLEHQKLLVAREGSDPVDSDGNE
jgi:hypothetical protein